MKQTPEERKAKQKQWQEANADYLKLSKEDKIEYRKHNNLQKTQRTEEKYEIDRKTLSAYLTIEEMDLIENILNSKYIFQGDIKLKRCSSCGMFSDIKTYKDNKQMADKKHYECRECMNRGNLFRKKVKTK